MEYEAFSQYQLEEVICQLGKTTGRAERCTRYTDRARIAIRIEDGNG